MITIDKIDDEVCVLALEQFKGANPDLFRKKDSALILHLTSVGLLLTLSTFFAVVSKSPFVSILFGSFSSFLWFCLINTLLHHHQTHHNAAKSPFLKNFLDLLFKVVLPNANKRKPRYVRAHLNHHRRPSHETDVDHLYGTKRFLKMMSRPWSAVVYFFELTFVGAHVPGWEDDRYMNEVPLESWNQKDYEQVKRRERPQALAVAFLQWVAFGSVLSASYYFIQFSIPLRLLAWGWIFPMLLVKNWAHFLGQFQHYDPVFLDPEQSIYRKTKTFSVPRWLNYLAAGEISGHFLHHLYPEMPYYYVEKARRLFVKDEELKRLFLDIPTAKMSCAS